MTNTNTTSTKTIDIGLYRLPQVLSMVPVSKSTWWKWVAEGFAPKPLKLGPNTTVWRAEDIAAFLAKAGGDQ